MKVLVPLVVFGLLCSTAAVHPQPYDRGPPPPPLDYAPPPPHEDAPPMHRMLCVIDTPFPYHQQSCVTHSGFPGSPCRCEGSLFQGERILIE